MSLNTDVKDTYNIISDEFSKTRYTVWDAVKVFLDDISPNTVLADIGCGNGKNMLYRKDITNIGMDICENFVKICCERMLNVTHGSILNIPFDTNIADNTICIAVIHHLKTVEERILAISELIRITKPGGHIMIYVWCFEQDAKSKRQFKTQDEMVSFKNRDGEILSYRYYHLYIQGELEKEINMVNNYNFVIEKSFKDRNNYVCVIKKN
jgi:ubiquinone/menaquinone biosynthesis C-methylase UbiE